MVKYWFTYRGIARDTFLVEILDDAFDGEKTELNGFVIHNYTERKDLLQSIIPSSLTIQLEANENLTLEDLYTEEESKFKVRLIRNEQVIFYGILKPDGIWQDFVNPNWTIDIDAMDGLSILKELSFVKDSGAFYEDQLTQFDAVKQCLHRIGYDLPINISDKLPYYVGFDSDDSILKSVLINADRFYQEKETDQIMDCEEVLKSVLELYNATIIQMNGEWWIYRTIDVSDSMNFIRYDEEIRTNVIWSAELEIGSQINDFSIFHANANQKISINPSTQAFRVNYKYGTVKNILQNPYLEVDEDLNSDGWIIHQINEKVRAQDDGTGIIFQTDGIDEGWIIELDQSVVLGKLEAVSVDLGIQTICDDETLNIDISVYLATENFVFDFDKWVPKTSIFPISSRSVSTFGSSEFNASFEFSEIPETGPIYFQVYVNSNNDIAFPVNYSVYFNSIDIKPSATSKNIFKGEFHTAQRLTRISTVTKSDKTVNNGDSVSDIYFGTLYKENGDPTELWLRNGDLIGKPILHLMVEDTLRISPKPMYLFEGYVYGYFPYLKNVLINNLNGKYQVLKYSYDTVSNVNKMNFSEYSTEQLIQDVNYRYEFQYDYGNVTKVTIR